MQAQAAEFSGFRRKIPLLLLRRVWNSLSRFIYFKTGSSNASKHAWQTHRVLWRRDENT
jgi:hypothetical protein